MRLALLVGTLVAFEQAPALQISPTDMTLDVGLFAYRVDGTGAGSAIHTGTTSAASQSFYTSESLCMLGSGDRAPDSARQMGAPEASQVAYRWQVSIDVRQWRGDAAVVALDWQRVVDRGQPVTGGGGHSVTTLHLGDRLPLDLLVTPSPSCAIARIGLEARLVVSPERQGGPSAGGRGGGAASSTMTVVQRGGRTSSGSDPLGRGPSSADLNAPTPLYAVDLWLVHTPPKGVEEIQYQRLRAITSVGQVFSFAPIDIAVPAGTATVEITGSLAVKAPTATGTPQFLFAMGRNVTLAGQSRNAILNAPDFRGSSHTAVLLPGPQEVLSFEMPPLRFVPFASTEDLFSVRVRVTPPMR